MPGPLEDRRSPFHGLDVQGDPVRLGDSFRVVGTAAEDICEFTEQIDQLFLGVLVCCEVAVFFEVKCLLNPFPSFLVTHTLAGVPPAVLTPAVQLFLCGPCP